MKSLGIYFLDGTLLHVGAQYGKLQTDQIITDDLLQIISNRLPMDVRQLAMEHDNGIRLEMEFGKQRECFIGFIYDDETIYYFDNGSGNQEPRPLIANTCPQEKMLCYSMKDILNIFTNFCKTGVKDKQYHWISDWSDKI